MTCSETVQMIVLDYLRSLAISKKYGFRKGHTKQYNRQIEDLIVYVSMQKGIHVIFDKKRKSKKAKDNTNIPESDTKPVNNTETTTPNDGSITMKAITVRKAIEDLIRKHKIECFDNEYQIVLANDELLKMYPILNAAEQIEIKALEIESYLLLHIKQEKYANALCEYINSYFFSDDIYCIALGQMILCLQFILPDNSTYEKKRPLSERLSKCLKFFPFTEISVPDDNIDGLKPDEINDMYWPGWNENKQFIDPFNIF